MKQSQLMVTAALISQSLSSLESLQHAISVQKGLLLDQQQSIMDALADILMDESPSMTYPAACHQIRLSVARAARSPETAEQGYSSPENTSPPSGGDGTQESKVGRQCELCWQSFTDPYHWVKTTLSCGIVSRELRTCQHCLEVYLPAPI